MTPLEFTVTLCQGLLLFVISASLCYVVVTFTGTLLHRKARQPHNNTSLRLAHWLKVFFSEWATAAMVYVFRIKAILWPSTVRPQPATEAPIILIHGFLDRPTTWWWFKRRLAKEVAAPIYVVPLTPSFGSIAKIATEFARQVDHILAVTGQRSVHLVGHSMGGLVATYYASHLTGSVEVLSLATLGSPFAGTHIAPLAKCQNAREMRTDSEFVQALQQEFAELSCPRLQVASLCDNVIIPWQSALVDVGQDPKAKQVIYTNIGHARMLFAPEVAATVCTHITANQPLSQLELPAEGIRQS